MYAYKVWIKDLGNADTAKIYRATSSINALEQFVSEYCEREGTDKLRAHIMTMSDGYCRTEEHAVKADKVYTYKLEIDGCSCRGLNHRGNCPKYTNQLD